MSTQGIGNIPAADVPIVTTQEAGTAAPIAIHDEAGAQVSASTLTSLFNQSGQYVGSYGIDPSTGAFAAWNAQGDEVSYQAFAEEHQLASGAVPIAANGGSAVLYNSSGQIIGLDVAGYIVNSSSDVGGETNTTSIYDTDGALAGSITDGGASGGTGKLSLHIVYSLNDKYENPNATTILESEGFSSSEVTQIGDQQAGWNLSNSTDSIGRGALIQYILGTVPNTEGDAVTNVYSADGGYVGSIGNSNGGFVEFSQEGTTNPTQVLSSLGISSSQESQALSLLSGQSSVQYATASNANLLSINGAISADLLDQGNSIEGGVDLWSSTGTFEAVLGIDTSTGQLAADGPAGNVVDLNFALEYNDGLSAATIASAMQAWSVSAGEISSAETSALSSVVKDADSLAPEYSAVGGPVAALTPAEIAALTATQLAAITPQQLVTLSSAQVGALTATQLGELTGAQVAALNAGAISISALSGLSTAGVQSLNAAQLSSAQVAALGSLADAFTALQFWRLDSAAVSGFTISAVAGFTPAQVSQLFAAGAPQLSTSQLAVLTAAQLAGGANISKLSTEQIAAIAPAAFAGLSADQLSSLSATQTQGLTNAQIQAITPASISGLAVGNLSVPQLQLLSSAQFGALTSQQISGLSIAEIQSLTPAQIQIITPNAMSGLTSEGLTALSLAQFQALSGAQIASLNNLAIMFGLTAAEIQALLPAQLGALTASQIGLLTSAQLSEFSTTQIAQLTTQQISGLESTQIAELTPEQLAGFGSSQLSALTSAQVAGITDLQYASLSSSQAAGLRSPAATDVAFGTLSDFSLIGESTDGVSISTDSAGDVDLSYSGSTGSGSAVYSMDGSLESEELDLSNGAQVIYTRDTSGDSLAEDIQADGSGTWQAIPASGSGSTGAAGNVALSSVTGPDGEQTWGTWTQTQNTPQGTVTITTSYYWPDAEDLEQSRGSLQDGLDLANTVSEAVSQGYEAAGQESAAQTAGNISASILASQAIAAMLPAAVINIVGPGYKTTIQNGVSSTSFSSGNLAAQFMWKYNGSSYTKDIYDDGTQYQDQFNLTSGTSFQTWTSGDIVTTEYTDKDDSIWTLTVQNGNISTTTYESNNDFATSTFTETGAVNATGTTEGGLVITESGTEGSGSSELTFQYSFDPSTGTGEDISTDSYGNTTITWTDGDGDVIGTEYIPAGGSPPSDGPPEM